jgi:hypothetical protein
MRFFAAMKMILARASGMEVLNALAHDAIKKRIVPVLEEEASEGDLGAAELVEMYESYTGTGPRSEIFGGQAFKVIRTVANMYSLDSDGVDELVMQFVNDFYRQRSVDKLLNNKKQKETVIDRGPEAFAKWFTGIVRFDAMSNARKVTTRSREDRVSPLEDETGDPMSRFPGGGDSPMEALVEKDVQRELREFISRSFGRKPVYMELFDEWMDALKKNGSGTNVRRDVLPAVSDRTGTPEKTLYHYINEMKRSIGQFFLREYNLRMPIKASSGMSLSDRIVYSVFRRRMAKWILPRETIISMLISR